MHPEAIKNFNKKAEEAIVLVEKKQKPKHHKESNLNGHYVAHKINKEDIIGEMKLGITNTFGDDLGFLFQIDQREYGITGDDYTQIIKCAEKIQKDKSYCEILSVSFILKKYKKWIIDRYQKKEEKDFISFLEYNLNKAVNKYQVWVPIPYTSTEKEFSINNVMIRKISEDIISSWFRIDNNKNDAEMLQKIEECKTEIRKKYQGYAAAVYEYRAEPIRAQEIAMDHISDALSILRLFSPSNFSSRLVSGIYEYGQGLMESKNLFLINPVNLYFSQTSDSLGKGMRWEIPSYIISNPAMTGFNKILLNKYKNKFNKKVYEALKIYSKHTLKNNPFDKLLYICIALESILLRNNTEAVQQNLADRIAFSIEKSSNGRQNIARTIRKIYSMRSNYVHHGVQTIEEREEIDKLLDITWRMFIFLAHNINRFKTKDDFIKALENIKYS